MVYAMCVFLCSFYQSSVIIMKKLIRYHAVHMLATIATRITSMTIVA